VRRHAKRRVPPVPGSIAAALDIFGAKVRLYRQIAPVAGVRVPACYQASQTSEGTVLVLEELSGWQPGAGPAAAAGVLAALHRRWKGQADLRWPWLRRSGAAVNLVEDLFGQTWPGLGLCPHSQLVSRLATGRALSASRPRPST